MDRLWTRQRPLYCDRRERDSRELSDTDQPARQDSAHRRPYRRLSRRPCRELRDPLRQPVRRNREVVRGEKSSRSVCAIRSATVSTAPPATSSSPTSGRTRSRRSTPGSKAPIMAGLLPKGRQATLRSQIRSFPMTIASDRPSSAAMSTAAPARDCRASISMPMRWRARSLRCISTAAHGTRPSGPRRSPRTPAR